MRATPWLLPQEGAARRQLRLFCFHYGGGNASVFSDWRGDIDPRVQLVAVQLPGRQARFREPLLHSASAIVAALVAELKYWLDTPYVLFGHSIGSLLAYEVACALRARGLPTPCEIIASGGQAPHIPSREPPITGASDEEFIERLRQYGGAPQELLANVELMRLFLPMIRADFAVSESYSWPAHAPLHCAVTALGGKLDASTPEEDVRAWAAMTRADFACHMIEGGHFFIHSHRGEVLAHLNRSLERWLAVTALIGAKAPTRG